MPLEPIEAQILEGVRAALGAIRADAFYHYDVDAAYIVSRPQFKHLAEHRTLALVHPGGAIFSPLTGCATSVNGDFYVTVARRVDGPELPWEGGYEPVVQVQYRLAEDVKRAIHGKQFSTANVYVFFTDRDVLGVEADGWAVAQAQLSYELNVAD